MFKYIAYIVIAVSIIFLSLAVNDGVDMMSNQTSYNHQVEEAAGYFNR